MNYQFLVETFFVALSGVPIALLVTVVALLVALPLGFLLALTRINKIPIIHHLAKIYVSFVRGTPIIIQIFIKSIRFGMRSLSLLLVQQQF